METEAREADWVVHSPATSLWPAGVCCRASAKDSRPSARLPPGRVGLRRGPSGGSLAGRHVPGAGRKGRGAGLTRGGRGWRAGGGAGAREVAELCHSPPARASSAPWTPAGLGGGRAEPAEPAGPAMGDRERNKKRLLELLQAAGTGNAHCADCGAAGKGAAAGSRTPARRPPLLLPDQVPSRAPAGPGRDPSDTFSLRPPRTQTANVRLAPSTALSTAALHSSPEPRPPDLPTLDPNPSVSLDPVTRPRTQMP